MIRGVTRRECIRRFQDLVNGYWERLSQAGARGGVLAVWPKIVPDQSEQVIEAALGDQLIREHTPMATFEDVEILREGCEHEGVLMGRPPSAIVIGIQNMRIEPDGDGFALRTAWYKYGLLLRAERARHLEAPAWFALRLESDARVGWNSWLLNHPIHHYQLGLRDDLRILSRDGRSLVSFVDTAIRLFVPEVWAEMYPALHLELTEPTGAFAAVTQRSPGVDVDLTGEHARRANETLRQARAEGRDWYRDLEQWRSDVAPWSKCTPELFDVLAG